MKIQTIGTGSSGNCYIVSDGETTLLIECGLSFKKIKETLGDSFLDVNKCLITHRHSDHIKSLRMCLKHHIDCYMISDVVEHLRFECSDLPGKVKIIRSQDTFKCGTFDVNSFKLNHSVPIVGYLLHSKVNDDTLLFATDTTGIFCPESEIIMEFDNLTHIMIEANYCEKTLVKNENNGIINVHQAKITRDTHMELETAINFIKKQDISKLEEIHLLHLSAKNANEEKFKDRFRDEFKHVDLFYNNKG